MELQPRQCVIAKRVVKASGEFLFHTTSLGSLRGILSKGRLKANPYVSFSDKPYFGDISGNGAVLVFHRSALRGLVMQVVYVDEWFDEYRDHGEYIAGEGWREQFVLDDYLEEGDIDEDGWIDSDVEEEAWRLGALESFLQKSDEDEWISIHEGQDVQFDPEDVDVILVRNEMKPLCVDIQDDYPEYEFGEISRY